MNKKPKHNGFAIALAWPQTYCKQPGTWYDSITGLLGFNKNNYYMAGHAAVVLIDIGNRKCHYFDFGRYHSPYQKGRVRSAITDHDLEIKTIPRISADGKTIKNIRNILEELQFNKACHGEGELFASYCHINFQSSNNEAQLLQHNSPIPYGPFRYQGTNCSRFVNRTILAGKPGLKQKINLKYFVPLTPTPLNNVNSLNHKIVLPELREDEGFVPLEKLDQELLKSTLPPPLRNSGIPENAQWLSGEGVGSWFVISYAEGLLKVTRYSPSGDIECSGLYKNRSTTKDILVENLNVSYPSNCSLITLKNGSSRHIFENIG